MSSQRDAAFMYRVLRGRFVSFRMVRVLTTGRFVILRSRVGLLGRCVWVLRTLGRVDELVTAIGSSRRGSVCLCCCRAFGLIYVPDVSEHTYVSR